MPLPLLDLLLFLLVQKRTFAETNGARRRPILFLLAISGIYLGYLASGPWVQFRYLTMLLPIAAILLAEVTTMALRVNIALGVVIIAGLITTDFMHRIPLGYIDPGCYKCGRSIPVDRASSIPPSWTCSTR